MKRIIPILFVFIASGYLLFVWLYRTPLPQDIYFHIVGKQVTIEGSTVVQEYKVYERTHSHSTPHFKKEMIERNAWLDTVWRYKAFMNCKNNLSQIFFIDSVTLVDPITQLSQPTRFSIDNFTVPKYGLFKLDIYEPLKLITYHNKTADRDSLLDFLFRSHRISFRIHTSMGPFYCVPEKYDTKNYFEDLAIKEGIAP